MDMVLDVEGARHCREAIGALADRPELRTVSERTIENAVPDVLLTALSEGREVTDSDLSLAIDTILAMPVRKWGVLRPVHGATFSGEAPTKLGQCTVYSYPKHRELLSLVKRTAEVSWLSRQDAECLVSVSVVARESTRAVESQ